MATVLVIMVDFDDDSDFDYFRGRFVDACEEIADIAMNGDESIQEPARADGSITVSWDTQEEN